MSRLELRWRERERRMPEQQTSREYLDFVIDGVSLWDLLLAGMRRGYLRAAAGEDVPLNEYYFYTNPIFQTGAPQYDWLNRTVAIGRGRVVQGGVEYRVWAVSGP